MAETLSYRGLQFLILETARSYSKGKINKFNLLGKPHQPGDVERKIDRELNAAERALTARAFDDLVAKELLQPEFGDLVSPDHWFTITELGRYALDRRALDELDEALKDISLKLVELRDGMWEAWHSKRTNALQQAAHSARELLDQTLKTGAPDIEGRRARAKHLLATKAGNSSDGELDLADAEINCLLKGDDRLQASAHARGELDRRKVQDLLLGVEIALRRILLP